MAQIVCRCVNSPRGQRRNHATCMTNFFGHLCTYLNHECKQFTLFYGSWTSLTRARSQLGVRTTQLKFTYKMTCLLITVCGGAALCRSALNRPVCYCPDGFKGNPYDECKKVRKEGHHTEKLPATWRTLTLPLFHARRHSFSKAWQ